MTDTTADRPAQISTSINIHLYGQPTVSPHYHAGRPDAPNYGGSYGYVSLGTGGGADVTVFVRSADQAQIIGNTFLHLATQFVLAEPAAVELPTETERRAAAGDDQALDALAEQDAAGRVALISVVQRDPADDESWVFRCDELHTSSVEGMAPCRGWQSADYASQDDALIAAGDHAHEVHALSLAPELAERVAAAERRAVGAE